MLNKEIPFLRICVPLCLGIITGLRIDPGRTGIIFLVSTSLAAFIISLYFNRRLTNSVFGFAAFITFFSTGLVLYTIEKKSLTSLESLPSIFTGTITDYPSEKSKSMMLAVKLNSLIIDGKPERVKGSIILYNKKDPKIEAFKPGDIVAFRCTPLNIENRGNPYEFNYKFYMESKGVRYYGFTATNDLLSVRSPENRKIRYTALIIRNRIIKMYEQRGLSGKRLALAAAITLGEKEGLDQEQKQHFIKAGVMHIMAVSGLHAMILSLFVFNLLFFLKRRYNLLRVVLTILFLWAFAFITGLTPSVLRATLMFTFLQAGNLLQRRVNGINSILASAFVLILFRPSVIFDAGFLLSYSAVIFIIGFYGEFHKLLIFRNKLMDLTWQSVSVTMVAQAGTLPLTIMLFNRFPTLFLATNAIIVPLSSLVVITGCVLPFFYPFVQISGLLAFSLDRLTGVTEFLTSKAASVPWSTIENIGLTLPECVIMFIFIALILSFLVIKPRIKLVYPLTALLLFTTAVTVKNISVASGNELIIYNTPGYATIGFRSGKALIVYSENPETPSEVRRHSSVLGLKTELRMLTDSALKIRAGKTNILICEKPFKDWRISGENDILIITGKKSFSGSDLPFYTRSEEIDIILAVSAKNIVKQVGFMGGHYTRIRSVKESGAIRTRLGPEERNL